ncbi:hypothetical protein ABTN17_20475, partial [Acinetobacter baumannii]
WLLIEARGEQGSADARKRNKRRDALMDALRSTDQNFLVWQSPIDCMSGGDQSVHGHNDAKWIT